MPGRRAVRRQLAAYGGVGGAPGKAQAFAQRLPLRVIALVGHGRGSAPAGRDGFGDLADVGPHQRLHIYGEFAQRPGGEREVGGGIGNRGARRVPGQHGWSSPAPSGRRSWGPRAAPACGPPSGCPGARPPGGPRRRRWCADPPGPTAARGARPAWPACARASAASASAWPAARPGEFRAKTARAIASASRAALSGLLTFPARASRTSRARSTSSQPRKELRGLSPPPGRSAACRSTRLHLRGDQRPHVGLEAHPLAARGPSAQGGDRLVGEQTRGVPAERALLVLSARVVGNASSGAGVQPRLTSGRPVDQPVWPAERG